MRNRKFGGRVREIISPNVGVCPNFMKGGFESRPLFRVQKVGNALQQEFVVVVVLCTRVTRVGIMKPNGLEAG